MIGGVFLWAAAVNSFGIHWLASLSPPRQATGGCCCWVRKHPRLLCSLFPKAFPSCSSRGYIISLFAAAAPLPPPDHVRLLACRTPSAFSTLHLEESLGPQDSSARNPVSKTKISCACSMYRLCATPTSTKHAGTIKTQPKTSCGITESPTHLLSRVFSEDDDQ